MTSAPALRKSLPGFLRRSLRVGYDEEDDDYNIDEGIVDGNSNKKSLKSQLSQEAIPETNAVEPSSTEASTNGAAGTSKRERSESLSIKDLASHSLSSFLSNDSNRSTSGSKAGGGAEVSTRSDDDPSVFSSDSWQQLPSPAIPDVTSSDPSSGSANLKNHSSESALQPRKTYRETAIEKILSSPVVNLSDLRRVGWNGIPVRHRSTAWKLLLGYLPTNAARREATLARRRREYLSDAVAQHYDINDDSRTMQEQETLRQVIVDVPRTAPSVPLFKNERIRTRLKRLLYIWAMRHPASSYVQGINDLATPLFAVFLAGYFEGQTEMVLSGHVMNHFPDDKLDELEADVYWCLTNLLAGIQDHYTQDLPGIQRMVMRLEELVNRIDADLSEHFRETGIQFMQFSSKWMNCLLLREFSLSCVFRLWDTYLSEVNGFEVFHVYVCAAFLCQFSSQLQDIQEFGDLFQFLQDIPTADWTDTEIEVLLSQAFVLSTLFADSDAHLTAGGPGS